MKYIKPDYFDEFSCIAQHCRHTCCQGWEIDVDEKALAFYQTVPGELGDELRNHILQDQDGAHFVLGEDDRCPFLNSQNLCRLILELGEEHLCQICADHPRYRNFYSDREEIGLGLCCEAAASLILRREQPVKLLEKGWEVLTEEERDLVDLRRGLIHAMQNRALTVEEWWAGVLRLANIEESDRSPDEWVEILFGLERLDPAWDEVLERMKGRGEFSRIWPEFSLPMEQLTVYFLYRHLPGALLDNDPPGRTAFCVLCTRLIWELTEEKTPEGLVETARAFSSEIEYSEENLCALLDALDEELY